MTRLGVLLYEQLNVPFRGFIIDNGRDATSSAVIFNENQFDYEPVAQYYESRADLTLLAALYDKIRVLLKPASEQEVPVMEALGPSELVNLLKANVRQYRNQNVRIAVENVELGKVQLISRYVRAFRDQQNQLTATGLRGSRFRTVRACPHPISRRRIFDSDAPSLRGRR
jgi:hypothetical protein